MAKNKNKKTAGKPEDKKKALELVMMSLEKEFGKGIVIRGNSTSFPEIERIPSGSIGLDKALNGGYARGRLIEIMGLESSGKTTTALHAVSECQKQGGICAFIDMEHALDLHYANALGVNIDELLVSQPDNGEQALNLVEQFTRSGALDLIIIDSVAALVPQAEIEGEIGDAHMGLQARLMSQAMRMLAGPAYNTSTTIIFVNQIRQKIGVFFGSNETTPGGTALRFYTSQRLDIRRIQTITEGENKTGIRVRVKVIKNKVGPPFKIAEFNIMFGCGIDRAAELLDMSVTMGLVEKAGAWYSYKGEQLGQGTVNATHTLQEKEELFTELKELLLNPPTPS